MSQKTSPIKNEYDWGEMLWLADGRHISNLDMSLAKMTVKPGKASERHVHSNCYECIHVISGALTEFIGPDSIQLLAGETVVIPPGTPHQSQNLGDTDVVMIISYSSEERNYEPIN